MNIFKWLLIFLIVGLSGCSTNPINPTYTIQIHNALENRESPKQIALFLDGTQNDRDSRTNIATMNEIVKHQDVDNLYIFYNEGVGTDGKLIGAGTGWGTGKDVAEAYSFLTKYYSPDSHLYIFGFSRGAYTSRILAGMIYAVGIYDLGQFEEEDHIKIAKDLYSEYKGLDKDLDGIISASKKVIDSWVKKYEELGKYVINVKRHNEVVIDVLGIWDTVEALGLKSTKEAIELKVFGKEDPKNIVNPNGRYMDQVCNIRNVYHALSLDDNRANIFTPIIISSNYVTSKCDNEKILVNSKVEEVWFSGAHSNVGGGYKKNDNNEKGDLTDRDLSLSGVSLNWMLKNIIEVAPSLLSYNARVYENPIGYVHDAQNGDMKYKEVSRNDILQKYDRYSKYKKIQIHKSVMERLSLSKQERNKHGYDSEWYKLEKFKSCFKDDSEGRYIYQICPEIEVVGDI